MKILDFCLNPDQLSTGLEPNLDLLVKKFASPAAVER